VLRASPVVARLLAIGGGRSGACLRKQRLSDRLSHLPRRASSGPALWQRTPLSVQTTVVSHSALRFQHRSQTCCARTRSLNFSGVCRHDRSSSPNCRTCLAKGTWASKSRELRRSDHPGPQVDKDPLPMGRSQEEGCRGNLSLQLYSGIGYSVRSAERSVSSPFGGAFRSVKEHHRR